MAHYSNYKQQSQPVGITEFEILKATHRFLRDEDTTTSENPVVNPSSTSKSWNEQLAEKYYSSLYREFALCDLKHYKSGNFALRWRSEDEVLSGAGETTCGNTRCDYHQPSTAASWSPRQKPKLVTLELPFAYVEMGETKSALVKVVLCPKCVKKLMWKHTKEKEKREGRDTDMTHDEPEGSRGKDRKKAKRKREDSDSDDNREEREHPRDKDRQKTVSFSAGVPSHEDPGSKTSKRSEPESHSSKRDRSSSRERDKRRHSSKERHSGRNHSRHERATEDRATSKERKPR